MCNNPAAAAEPCAHLLYVRSVAGVNPQIWFGLPNPHSDYWNARRAGVSRIMGQPVPLDDSETRLPLDVLSRLYPPAAESP
jgi:hypothetical protein